MIAIPTASAPASSVCAPDTVRRILYLDSLRGICAFVVAVFWHYRHFSALFQPRSMALPNAPYYTLFPFSLCYRYGYAAVDVFFLLSGFVFSYVYAQSIASGQVGPARFFANRFSRLYPLHLATLLYVALVVYLYTSLYHAVPIYQHNDLYHFLLNALFIQKGLFDRDLSFNGPAWSLSIEGFLYVAFFMLARRRLGLFWPSAGLLFSLIVLACRLHHRFLLNEEMARGAGGFFTGMVLFQSIDRKRWGLLLLPLTLIACDAMISWQVYGHDRHMVFTVLFYPLCWISVSVFLLLAHFTPPLRKCLEIKSLVALGDISLAMYLLHVPLQITLLFILRLFHVAVPYGSPWSLLTYAGILVVLSRIVYRYFEMPLQAWLRERLCR